MFEFDWCIIRAQCFNICIYPDNYFFVYMYVVYSILCTYLVDKVKSVYCNIPGVLTIFSFT